MTKFDMVAFDCDGVLVDSEPLTFKVFTAALNQLGWDISQEEATRRFVGKSFADEQLVIEAQIGRPLPLDFAERYLEQRDRILAEEVEAVRGVRAVLDGLVVGQRHFCVASGADRVKMNITLGRTGLLPLFENRMFSGMEVAQTKPAPDVYLLAAHTIGVPPARCVVIEDTPTGVRAGIAAGMTVYGYVERIDPQILLAAGAAAVFADMALLPAMLR